jgi:4-nitrophenyl phosphatase
MPHLNQIHGLVLDMDGVLWRGETLLPGIREFFGSVRARQLPFVLATNNATVTFKMVSNRLSTAAVDIVEREVFTSAEAAAGYLRQRLSAGSSVLPVGEAGLHAALSAAGYCLVETASGAQAVVAGLDRQVTWDLLTEAALAIRAGALFVGTNSDATLPTERGLEPGAGALLAVLQTATGEAPVIIGKPEPHLFLQALDRLGTAPQSTLVVGDRLETDILGGQRAGTRTGLVLTGVTGRSELEKSSIQPDYVFEDLPHLERALGGSDP